MNGPQQGLIATTPALLTVSGHEPRKVKAFHPKGHLLYSDVQKLPAAHPPLHRLKAI